MEIFFNYGIFSYQLLTARKGRYVVDSRKNSWRRNNIEKIKTKIKYNFIFSHYHWTVCSCWITFFILIYLSFSDSWPRLETLQSLLKNGKYLRLWMLILLQLIIKSNEGYFFLQICQIGKGGSKKVHVIFSTIQTKCKNIFWCMVFFSSNSRFNFILFPIDIPFIVVWELFKRPRYLHCTPRA